MYLNEDQVRSRLNLGKPVEQWLGISDEVEYTVLKWLRIDKERNNTFTIAYFECLDDGNEEFADIYEFSTLDPDEPFGLLKEFDSVDDALTFSIDTYQASFIKFVSGGMIQDEYLGYLNYKFSK